MITNNDLDNWFTYHSPNAEQVKKYQIIRDKAREMAQIIVDNTPSSADQSASIRLLRESIMTANASIACDGTTK